MSPTQRHYVSNPAHRDGTPGKSQWKISASEEVACFRATESASWFRGLAAWGLHRPSGRLAYVGVGRDGHTALFVAKFVGAPFNGGWHGYPADGTQHVADIPHSAVARDWLDAGVVPPAKVRKLMRGQRCVL